MNKKSLTEYLRSVLLEDSETDVLHKLFPELSNKSEAYMKGFTSAIKSFFNVGSSDNGAGSDDGFGGPMDPNNPPTKRMKSKSAGGSSKGKSLWDPFDDDTQSEDDKDAKDKNKNPQIGDTGNEETQKAEEIARQAEIMKERAEEAAKKAEARGDGELADDASDLADDAEKLAKEAAEADAARIKQIENAFNDIRRRDAIISETERAVFADRQLRADRTRSKISAADQFFDSFEGFIRDQIAYGRESTWKRPSKKYTVGSDVLSRGKGRDYNVKVPYIAVYFDQSGSWGPAKQKIGMKAVAYLQEMEEKGLLKVGVYYFSDTVSGNKADVANEGGTGATQLILDHIEEVGADNVIIMTDDDMDNQGAFYRHVTVPGAVWFLFVGGVCKKLMQYLDGEELTEAYELDK